MRSLYVTLVMSLAAASAFSSTLYVPSEFSTIQAGIDAAVDGDVVEVDAGIYTGAGNRDMELLGKAITVRSAYGPEATIIDCQSLGRAFYIRQGESPTTKIEGFTVRNGASSAGGAIRIQDASATIVSCVLESSQSPHGGALYINSSVNTCTFLDCTFSDNIALNDPKVDGDGNGGAVYTQYTDQITRFESCLFYRNDGAGGGAIASHQTGTTELANCTVVDNITIENGFAITATPLSVVRSIIAFNDGTSLYGENADVECSDIFGNQSGDWVGGIADLESIQGNFSLDPLFCDRHSHNYALGYTSPCLPSASPCLQIVGAIYTNPCGISLPAPSEISLVGENLLSVTDHNPLISWTYTDDPASSQAAYEIEVGTDPDWAVAEMWATGPINSSATNLIYSGAPLLDGNSYWIRIRVSNGTTWGDWLDRQFRMNSLPSVPTANSPVDGAEVGYLRTILQSSGSQDAESGTLTYQFQVWDQLNQPSPVWTDEITVTGGPAQVGPVAGLTAETQYWWQVRVFDGFEYSAWTDLMTFTAKDVTTLHVPGTYATIQDAIDVAHEAAVILLADGTYTGPGNTDLHFLGEPIELRSENGPEVTVIDCQNSSRALLIDQGEGNGTIINGITFVNGDADAGGAIRIQDASARIENCVFRNNHAAHGGALYVNSPVEPLEIVDCIFEGNPGTGDIKNDADGYGGAIYGQYCFNPVILTRCILADNQADVGGAVAVSKDAIFQLNNCTITSNQASYAGAALSSSSGAHIVLDRCIVAYNIGTTLVYCLSDITLECCDVYGNSGGDWTDCLAEQQYVDGNFSANPAFCHPETGDFTLRPYSPCIETVSPCGALVGALGAENCDFALPAALSAYPEGEDVLHVISHTPRFVWTFLDDPTDVQTAYELEVGLDNDWSTAEMWATGQVFLTDEFADYAGASLVDGTTYWYRIRVRGGGDWGGWATNTFRMNGVPSTPQIDFPSDLSTVRETDLHLSLYNSVDNEGDIKTYFFELYEDEAMTSLYWSASDLPEGVTSTSSGPVSGLQQGTAYWWRGRSFDGLEYSAWSPLARFDIGTQATLRVPAEYPTIQAAINAAWEGDLVLVGDGTYTGEGNKNLSLGGKPIELRSENGPDFTEIDCQGSGRAITMEGNVAPLDPGAVIEGFTFTNGSAYYAGAIVIWGGTARIENCIFRNNHAELGGAVYLRMLTSPVEIVDCIFEGNEETGEVKNDADDFGGAIFAERGATPASVTGCLFLNNEGNYGGAISVAYDFPLTLNNCTLVGNHARADGSALHARPNGTITVNNCIITDNTGASVAACEYGITIICSDLYNNEGGNWPSCIASQEFANNNFSLDPGFCDALGGDYSILGHSPCAPANSPCGQQVGALGTELCSFAYPAALQPDLGDEEASRVVSHQPVFHWTYIDDPSSAQAAFEIEVGTDDDWSSAEMWTSGTVTSPLSEATYVGTPLEDGADYWYRIRVSNGTSWGSWITRSFHMNSYPVAPTISSPADQSSVRLGILALIVQNSFDADDDPIGYFFEIATDPQFANIVWSADQIAEQSNTTGVTDITGLEADQTYWWRVRCFDGYEYSQWTDEVSFLTVGNLTFRVPSEYPTIQAAVNVTVSHDTVLVADGTYSGYGNTHVSFGGKTIKLRSENGPEFTTIDCENKSRAILLSQGEGIGTLISGFTFIDGHHDAGGAIRIQGATARVENCVFRNNHASHGGALYINSPVAPLEIVDCLFEGNPGVGDTKNDADGYGGAIYGQYGSYPVEISDCVFVGNESDFGGAFAVGNNLEFVLTNCTLARNHASQYGSAISFMSSSLVTLNRCIIAINTGAEVVSCGGNVVLNCCDVYGNEGGDWPPCIAAYQDIANNFSLNPHFCDPFYDNFSIPDFSPCAAQNSPCGEPVGASNLQDCDLILPYPTELTINNEVRDRVVNHQPELAWSYLDLPNSVQAAFEIEVGTDKDWSLAEMWSSGPVYSSDLFTTYAGSQLEDGTFYYARVRVNNGAGWGSWSTTHFRMNAYLPVPVPFSPVDGSSLRNVAASLVTNNSFDADGDPLTYGFELYDDFGMTSLAWSVAGLAEGSNQTSTGVLPALNLDQDYFWRVRVNDGFESSDWSELISFYSRGPGIVRVPTEFGTIQEAVNAAWDQDTVLVAEGSYSGAGNTNVDLIGRPISIISENGPEATVIDCEGNGRGFRIDSHEGTGTLIKGFTIINGDAYFAGAIVVWGATATIEDCIFRNNYSDLGGAIYLRDLDIPAEVINCIFEGSDESVVNKNEAEHYGGAVFAEKGTVPASLTRCLFLRNKGRYGGAVSVAYNTPLTIYQCTFVENDASRQGSALHARPSGSINASNCIIAHNTGAEVASCGDGITLRSCVLYNNEGGDWPNCIASQQSLSGNMTANPIFCGYVSGQEDFRLQDDSPCMPENNSSGQLIGAFGLGDECADFICGDADRDRVVTWLDVTYLSACYFYMGPLPNPIGAGDPNGDGYITITDLIYLVAYLRGEGEPPVCNFEYETRMLDARPPTVKPPGKNEPILDTLSSNAGGGVIK